MATSNCARTPASSSGVCSLPSIPNTCASSRTCAPACVLACVHVCVHALVLRCAQRGGDGQAVGEARARRQHCHPQAAWHRSSAMPAARTCARARACVCARARVCVPASRCGGEQHAIETAHGLSQPSTCAHCMCIMCASLVCTCVRACVRACVRVRARVLAYVCVRTYACVHVRACACMCVASSAAVLERSA